MEFCEFSFEYSFPPFCCLRRWVGNWKEKAPSFFFVRIENFSNFSCDYFEMPSWFYFIFVNILWVFWMTVVSLGMCTKFSAGIEQYCGVDWKRIVTWSSLEIKGLYLVLDECTFSMALQTCLVVRGKKMLLFGLVLFYYY